MKSTPRKRQGRIQRPIEVNGVKSILLVDLDWNEIDGNVKINARLTTKNLSRDETQMEAVYQQMNTMIHEAVTDSLQFNAEWKLNNSDKDTSQGELFDGEEPEEDQDGGPGDEGEPVGNTLDMAAAPRERRPRRNAHLEN